MRSLALGERVLIADPGHEVLQPRDPGASLLRVGRDQVQGLQVVAMVNGEAAAGVEAPLGVAVEDLRLPALADFVNGVDDNWGERETKGHAGTASQPLPASNNSELFRLRGTKLY